MAIYKELMMKIEKQKMISAGFVLVIEGINNLKKIDS